MEMTDTKHIEMHTPLYDLPSLWTIDGEQCVAERVFNGWGPKIVRAINNYDDLLAAAREFLNLDCRYDDLTDECGKAKLVLRYAVMRGGA